MHPDDAEGIIAVGLTSGDSTGIEAQSGGADGTAPMVLTRQRQCHPGPAGSAGEVRRPGAGAKRSFAIPRLQRNFRRRDTLDLFVRKDVSPKRRTVPNVSGKIAERQGAQPVCEGAKRNAPQRFR